MKKYTRGFTLIELLVVITIIGILTTVVFVSLTGARTKAGDVKVISAVKQIRNELEGNFDGIAYGGDDGSLGGNLTNDSDRKIFGGMNMESPSTSTLNVLLVDAITQGGEINVVNNPTSGPILGYAIYGKLVSSSTQYFCADSTGMTNPLVSALSWPIDSTCPPTSP